MVVYTIFISFLVYQIYEIKYNLFSKLFVAQTNYSINISYIITATISVGVYFYYLLDNSKSNGIVKTFIPVKTKILLRIESIKNLLKVILTSTLFYLLLSVGTITQFNKEFYINELLAIMHITSLVILGISVYILIKKITSRKYFSIILFQSLIASVIYIKGDQIQDLYKLSMNLYSIIFIGLLSLIFFIIFESKDYLMKGKTLTNIKYLKVFRNSIRLLLIQIIRIESLWLYFLIAILYLGYNILFNHIYNQKFDFNNIITFFSLALILTLIVKYKIVRVLYSLPNLKVRIQKVELVVISLSLLLSLVILQFSGNLTIENALFYFSILIFAFILLNLLKLNSTGKFNSLIFILLVVIFYQFLIPLSKSLSNFIHGIELYLFFTSTIVYFALFFNFLKARKNDFN